MSVLIQERGSAIEEKDKLIKSLLAQNNSLIEKVITLTESSNTAVDKLSTTFNSKAEELSSELRRISANTSVLSQKGGDSKKATTMKSVPNFQSALVLAN